MLVSLCYIFHTIIYIFANSLQLRTHCLFAILEQPFQKDAIIEVGHHAVGKKISL